MCVMSCHVITSVNRYCIFAASLIIVTIPLVSIFLGINKKNLWLFDRAEKNKFRLHESQEDDIH